MTMEGYRNRLAVLWFTGSGVLFLIVLLTTTFGFYQGLAADTFGWLFSNVLPTLSLMISVLITGRGKSSKQASTLVYQLAFWLSATYLAVLLLTVVLPVAIAILQPYSAPSPLDFLKEAQQIWLAPLQGLVAGLLGAFFLKS